MKRCALLVCLLALSALVVGQDSTPDTQMGNYLFHMPNGWKPVEKGEATYIMSPSQRPGTATFILLQAGDLDSDLQKSFNEFWTGFHSVYRIMQGGQIASMHAKNGYDALSTTAVMSDQSGIRWNVFAMGAQYGKRMQIVMFVSNEQGANYDANYKVFQSFLASLSFGDALPGQKLPPATGDAGSTDSAAKRDEPQNLPPGMLAGIYVCTAGGDGQPSNKQFLFYPDGLMVYGVPQEGMIGFDFNHYRSESNPDKNWVGRYKVKGEKIEIVWQNEFGDPAKPAIVKRNETSAHPAWEVGWDTFIPMCRCTGKKFSGKYIWGRPVADQYLQFFPDGTFIDHRVTDQLIVPSAFYEHPRIQRGTYSIQSQTLIFTFTDGRRGTRTFVAPKVQEKDQMFDWIGLGWQQLFEENYLAKISR
ncbi:MAG TPA: hypothetical protein VK738_06700 [Terriglobales bacterium]|nr:hypothetical protein [Terriglobales bacterium]